MKNNDYDDFIDAILYASRQYLEDELDISSMRQEDDDYQIGDEANLEDIDDADEDV